VRPAGGAEAESRPESKRAHVAHDGDDVFEVDVSDGSVAPTSARVVSPASPVPADGDHVEPDESVVAVRVHDYGATQHVWALDYLATIKTDAHLVTLHPVGFVETLHALRVAANSLHTQANVALAHTSDLYGELHIVLDNSFARFNIHTDASVVLDVLESLDMRMADIVDSMRGSAGRPCPNLVVFYTRIYNALKLVRSDDYADDVRKTIDVFDGIRRDTADEFKETYDSYPGRYLVNYSYTHKEPADITPFSTNIKYGWPLTVSSMQVFNKGWPVASMVIYTKGLYTDSTPDDAIRFFNHAVPHCMTGLMFLSVFRRNKDEAEVTACVAVMNNVDVGEPLGGMIQPTHNKDDGNVTIKCISPSPHDARVSRVHFVATRDIKKGDPLRFFIGTLVNKDRTPRRIMHLRAIEFAKAVPYTNTGVYGSTLFHVPEAMHLLTKHPLFGRVPAAHRHTTPEASLKYFAKRRRYFAEQAAGAPIDYGAGIVVPHGTDIEAVDVPTVHSRVGAGVVAVSPRVAASMRFTESPAKSRTAADEVSEMFAESDDETAGVPEPMRRSAGTSKPAHAPYAPPGNTDTSTLRTVGGGVASTDGTQIVPDGVYEAVVQEVGQHDDSIRPTDAMLGDVPVSRKDDGADASGCHTPTGQIMSVGAYALRDALSPLVGGTLSSLFGNDLFDVLGPVGGDVVV
jgi:hypothetical protein